MTRAQKLGIHRLWVVQSRFLPDLAGPAIRFMRYAPGMRHRDIELTIIAALKPGLPNEEIIDDVHVLRLGPSHQRVNNTLFFVAVFLRVLLSNQRPDVLLFLHTGFILIPLLPILKLLGVRAVFVSTMAWSSSTDRSRLRQSVSRLMQTILMRRFDRIVFSSQALRAVFQEAVSVPESRLVIIPNGVLLSRFCPPNSEETISARQHLGLPTDDLLVLYVGMRTHTKGILELVESWKQYRERGGQGYLVLVGQEARERPENASFFEKWDQYVAGLKPDDHVILRDPYAQIEYYFRAANLFILLSRIEGMPNVFLEAMASGLALLTTQFQGFSEELGRNGQEFVITEREPSAVCQHLEYLLTDDVWRHQLGAQARRWVEQYHDLDISLDRYMRLLIELKSVS